MIILTSIDNKYDKKMRYNRKQKVKNNGLHPLSEMDMRICARIENENNKQTTLISFDKNESNEKTLKILA